jgi:hypothetical protein
MRSVPSRFAEMITGKSWGQSARGGRGIWNFIRLWPPLGTVPDFPGRSGLQSRNVVRAVARQRNVDMNAVRTFRVDTAGLAARVTTELRSLAVAPR